MQHSILSKVLIKANWVFFYVFETTIWLTKLLFYSEKFFEGAKQWRVTRTVFNFWQFCTHSKKKYFICYSDCYLTVIHRLLLLRLVICNCRICVGIRAFRDGRFYPGRINLAGLFDWWFYSGWINPAGLIRVIVLKPRINPARLIHPE